MPTGAKLFASSLQQLGIDRIFTLVGDHLNEVLAEIARIGIDVIGMRHESGVTHAADAYARVLRQPAVALVTGGPGHTNALTGIATAQLACSPLIAVSGSRASTLANRGSFQDIDQVGMTRPVVKWAAETTAASQIPAYLQRAYTEANSGRRGAVHLTIPIDVFKAEAPETTVGQAAPEQSEPDRSIVTAALNLLHSAERPVIIAGSGIWWADAADELRTFIEATNLPLYTLTMARGVIPDEHPLCFGYADPALNRAALAALSEADVVMVLGKRIDYRLAFGGPRLFQPGARFIQVDIHPQELGLNRRIEVPIQADVKKTLRAMVAVASTQQWRRLPWLERISQFREEWRTKLQSQMDDAGTPLHPAAVYREVLRALPSDTLLSWDGGDFTHWGRAIIPARHAGGWLRLGPLGTIGSALPNAIALKLAKPDRPVVLITGDGALGFYIAEMETAVRYKRPMVIITGNDGGWGLERELQQAQGTLTEAGDTVVCELRRSQYDRVMQGFGGDGETVDRLDQVAPAVLRGLQSGVPYCININVRGARSPFTEWQIEAKR
jgi:acetolactate synthase-1/2/3 large subunit